MSTAAASTTPHAAAGLARACAGLLAVAALLGICANSLRPTESRLPWVGDWDRHVETLAFRAGIPTTFLLGARDWLARPQAVLLDARVPREYAAGHLPGALSMPLADAEARIADYVHLLDVDTPILVYCGGPECTDALDLAIRLRGWGFQAVSLYPGGFAEWTRYGSPVRTGGYEP